MGAQQSELGNQMAEIAKKAKKTDPNVTNLNREVVKMREPSSLGEGAGSANSVDGMIGRGRRRKSTKQNAQRANAIADLTG